jgi:hypothetical protein
MTNKLELLKDTYTDEAELDLVLSKVLDLTLDRYRTRLQRYERELGEFEQRYQVDSRDFYQRFQAGEMGDAMDYFEWAGLYELRQALLDKIERLETVK